MLIISFPPPESRKVQQQYKLLFVQKGVSARRGEGTRGNFCLKKMLEKSSRSSVGKTAGQKALLTPSICTSLDSGFVIARQREIFSHGLAEVLPNSACTFFP